MPGRQSRIRRRMEEAFVFIVDQVSGFGFRVSGFGYWVSSDE